MKKITLLAAIGVMALSSSAFAGPGWINGPTLNGISFNGFRPNGISFNGKNTNNIHNAGSNGSLRIEGVKLEGGRLVAR